MSALPPCLYTRPISYFSAETRMEIKSPELQSVEESYQQLQQHRVQSRCCASSWKRQMHEASDHVGQQDSCGTLDQHQSSEIWAAAAAGRIAGRVWPLSCSRVPPRTPRRGSKPGSAVPGPLLPRGGRGVPSVGAARCPVPPGTFNPPWSGEEQHSHTLENWDFFLFLFEHIL